MSARRSLRAHEATGASPAEPLPALRFAAAGNLACKREWPGRTIASYERIQQLLAKPDSHCDRYVDCDHGSRGQCTNYS